jgi:hypothetical protein
MVLAVSGECVFKCVKRVKRVKCVKCVRCRIQIELDDYNERASMKLNSKFGTRCVTQYLEYPITILLHFD